MSTRFGSSVRWALLIALTTLVVASPHARAATLVIEDFEDVSDWSGLQPETGLVQEGSGAGRWPDTVARTSIHRDFDPPLDLSAYDHLGLWVYSAAANGAELQFVWNSEDDTTTGSDYYSTVLRVDWQGWQWIWLSRDALGASRSPVGWDTIRSVSLSASGWGHTPLADTDLVFDQLVATNAVVADVVRRQAWQGSDFVYTFEVTLQEPDGVPLGVDVQADTSAAPSAVTADIQPAHVDLTADGSAVVTVTITLPPSVMDDGPYVSWDVALTALTDEGGRESFIEPITTPPDPVGPPRMLLTAEDITRMNTWAGLHAWAQSRRQRILDRADAWPADFLGDYGLAAVALPPEGGQWGMHYVCPDHGVDLDYEPPMTHRCPVDGATFTGWPYDQVIYAREHNALATAMRDLGLAWQLTGDTSYASAARELLLDYADAYESYPIHDTTGGDSESGARALSQTLDESGWLIRVAWAYDLIADSGVLSAADRDHIEQHLLRPAAAIIARHDAGTSNWQAWHNAAIAAAGRALADPRLVAHALYGPSGFHFHMAESVLEDGFWYEGSWGYHFYTLSPMTYLAEMGERGQFPLYDDPALRSMYFAPILFAPPDLVLPAFNDSGEVDLRGSAGWRIEAAYRAYDDDTLLIPLVGESRPEEALFWGAETLPTEAPTVTDSVLFEASGYAILRGGSLEDPWWAALDFGPHGGWHGHFDKLGLVLFGRGRMLGLDPGSHSYALPLHDSWDRSTVAHNTVVVDEAVQNEATGDLLGFEPLPGLTWVRADGGEAAPNVTLVRDVVLADGYVVDRFTADATDGAAHRFDWFWHAEGALQSDVPTTAYSDLPSDAGYQHLRDNQGADTDDDIQLAFLWDADSSYPGGTWSNDSAVVASLDYDDSDAHGGHWSGRLSYDFSAAAADAYITFRTRSMADFKTEAPTAVRVWVRGDGSGHSFRLRVVDATGESHVSEEATLDFDGWQELRYDITGWSHWGGNDDGIIDLPLDNLVFQLNREAGGPASGAVLLDDWRLVFPTAGEQVAEDYERLTARSRLWIAGEPGTTLVTGTGIGRDLETPVPYAMVRRQAEATQYHVLHEPYGLSGPAVTGFSVLPPPATGGSDNAGYVIETDARIDHLLLTGAGATGTGPPRSFGDWSTDGRLAYVRTTASATGMTALALVAGRQVESGDRPLLTVPRVLDRAAFAIRPPEVEVVVAEGDLEDGRLWAPGTTQVTYGGEDVDFEMDGEYVVFGHLPDIETPPDGKKGCGCHQDGGPHSALLGLLGLALLLWIRRRRLHP